MLVLPGVFLFVALAGSEAVKVNMMGSLSLGQEVVDVLAEYVKENLVERNARRMMKSPDVPAVVRDARLCRDIPFCSGTYESNINDYIVSLYKAIAEVFEGTLKGEAFELKSKRYLRDVRKVLQRADTKVSEDNEVHEWTSVIKKISSTFLERAREYMDDRIDADVEKKNAVARVLMQQLAIAVVKVEMQYQAMFCTEHSVCIRKFECTRALNEVLGVVIKLDDDRVREFMKALRESLTHTALMLRLDERLRKEFERILKTMSQSEQSPAKGIFASVRRSIERRLKGEEPRGNDALLMHAVLSDMDHVFDMRKHPFEHFLDKFSDWAQKGSYLESNLKQLFREIEDGLSAHSSHFTFKLFSEAQAFLELTIGSAVTT